MRSIPHFLVSVGLGVLLVVVLKPSIPAPVIVGYAGALGVAIDVDHFPIARWNSGTWSALRRVLARPHVVVLDQDAIFEYDHVWPLQRLLSHVAIGSVLVGVSFLVVPTVALVSAVVVYGHVLADLASDNLRHEDHLREAARYCAERDNIPGQE